MQNLTGSYFLNTPLPNSGAPHGLPLVCPLLTGPLFSHHTQKSEGPFPTRCQGMNYLQQHTQWPPSRQGEDKITLAGTGPWYLAVILLIALLRIHSFLSATGSMLPLMWSHTDPRTFARAPYLFWTVSARWLPSNSLGLLYHSLASGPPLLFLSFIFFFRDISIANTLYTLFNPTPTFHIP